MNDNITLPRVVAAAITQILIDSQSVSDYQLEREEWAEKQIADALAQDDFKQEVADSALLGNIESPFNACMHQEHCKAWKEKASADTPATADLTDDQIIDLFHRKTTGLGCKGIIAFARAMLGAAPHPPTVKECLTVEQPQVEQEPVDEAAFMPGTTGFTMACFLASDVPVGTKLYTNPQPKREPLTDAQAKALLAELTGRDTACANDYNWDYELRIIRIIEAAHNIK